MYVANRVQQIRDLSQPTAWMYVESNENRADHAIHGLTAEELMEKSHWSSGAEFLFGKMENFSLTPKRLVL